MDRVRVVIVDDDQLVRMSLRLMLDGEADLEVAGEAADGDAAIAEVRLPGRTWC